MQCLRTGRFVAESQDHPADTRGRGEDVFQCGDRRGGRRHLRSDRRPERSGGGTHFRLHLHGFRHGEQDRLLPTLVYVAIDPHANTCCTVPGEDERARGCEDPAQ